MVNVLARACLPARALPPACSTPALPCTLASAASHGRTASPPTPRSSAGGPPSLLAAACPLNPRAFNSRVRAQVLKVNGQPINNLKDLVSVIGAATGQYISFDLEYNQVREAVRTGSTSDAPNAPEGVPWGQQAGAVLQLACWSPEHPRRLPALAASLRPLTPLAEAATCSPAAQLVILDRAAADAATADILTQASKQGRLSGGCVGLVEVTWRQPAVGAC